jgi:DNA-binding NtrC family response regulator
VLEELRTRLAKAAGVDSPVLITGETGTGKELVARWLLAEGARHAHPFVALNCAALVEGLLESELFGHEKGAFTGATERHEGKIAQAGEGTLFLDEIGDMPLTLQAKLLRVLSEGTYTRVGGKTQERMQCRVVAATNRDLEAMVVKKTFRQDLFYRLAVLVLDTPPLRDRGADVELLAEVGLEQLAAKLGRRVPRLAADAREALRGYPWPGNVRELFNVLERALVLAEGDTLTAADLPREVREGQVGGAAAGEAPMAVRTLREAERATVAAALRATGGRKGRAAELLGISWPTLNRKIREYGLEASKEEAAGD